MNSLELELTLKFGLLLFEMVTTFPFFPGMDPFTAIAQSCDSAINAGACATMQTTQRNLARQKTRRRWRMAAVNVLSVL